MQSDDPNKRTLQEWYQIYNENHFGSKLPADVRVRYSNTLPSHEIARTRFLGKEWKPSRIWVNSTFRPYTTLVCLYLLHELAHISVVQSGHLTTEHDDVFQAVMQRLAQDGAFSELW